MSKPVRNVLVTCSVSWGGIDWLLPVLVALRERMAARVVVYFRTEGLFRQRRQFADLHARLQQAGIELVSPAGLAAGIPWIEKLLVAWHAWRREGGLFTLLMRCLTAWTGRFFAAGKLPGDQRVEWLAERFSGGVDLLFHDVGQRRHEALYEQFPAAQVAVYPHGTNSLAEQQIDFRTVEHLRVKPVIDAVPADAVWLTGRAEDLSYWRKLGVGCRIAAVGHPKLDAEWIEHVRQSAKEASGKFRLLLLSMPPSKASNPPAFHRLLESFFQVARIQGVELLIKPHPRESLRKLRRLVRSTGLTDVEYVQESVLQAASRADAVVSFPSSAVMDAVAVGVPVIEYFDFTSQDYPSFIEVDGQRTSIYRASGLAVPVNTSSELVFTLAKWQANPQYRDEIARQQRAALDAVLASRCRAIDLALQAVTNRRASSAA